MGVNQGSRFADYVLDAALGASIRDRCVEAYQFIVEHYNAARKDRVWLFGLSRGAYTVRCVAGMINNCGILRKDLIDARGVMMAAACREVYYIYVDPSPEMHPNVSSGPGEQRVGGTEVDQGATKG